jgi:GNAT superfamily N-acetyltransferase
MKKIICLKDAKEELIGQAVDLFFRNFPRLPSTQEMYFDGIVPKERLFAYTDGKTVFGALKRGYDFDWNVVSIDLLVAKEDHRRLGVGTKLLSGFEAYLREQGIPKVGLKPRAEEMVVDFYSKNGYHMVRARHPVWMEKNLS